ncbi:hypothetical protein [Methylobacterium sp. A54F]
MDLDGAENAKAEVFLRAFRFGEVPMVALADDAPPLFMALPGSEAFDAIEAARQTGEPDPRDLIAVGIVGDGEGERALGLFVQQARLRHHPVVERALDIVGPNEVRVIVTGRIKARGGRARCRPLRIGSSVGHHLTTAGTLGCFVRCRTGGQVGILSNNHVLALANAGACGDIILQPGAADGGHLHHAANHAAQLDRFVPIGFGAGAINLLDCAFAPVLDGTACAAGQVSDHGGRHVCTLTGGIEAPLLPGLSVLKVGRTTDCTHGAVIAIDVENVTVQMPDRGSIRLMRFDRQVAIGGRDGAFSRAGDSGSLILTEDGQAVGLLFAGTSRGGPNGHGITFANPIQSVLNALDVDIYTGP